MVAKILKDFRKNNGEIVFDEIENSNEVRFRVSDEDSEKSEHSERSERSKVEAAQAMAERFGKGVRVVRDVAEIKRMPEYERASYEKKLQMLRSQGWVDMTTGEVVVVTPNNLDVADIKKTMFHEVVGHYGLQQMVGKENFTNFLNEVYKHADAELRAKITDLAKRRGWDYQLAIVGREVFGLWRAGSDES